MSDDQTDLRAVREFTLSRAPASPALTALRERVVAPRPRGTATAPRFKRRWPVPLASAAVALAVLAGVAAVFGRGAGPAVNPPGASGKPPGAAVQGQPLDVARAFADLRQAATQSPPLTVPPGGLLYTRVDTVTFNLPPNAAPDGPEERWIDPQGMIVLRDLVGGKVPAEPKGPVVDNVAEQRSAFAEAGPGVAFPTPAWLAALPTDPDALATVLRPATVPPGETAENTIFNVYVQLFQKLDPLLPVGVRIALLDLLARYPGVGVDAVTVDGAALDAVRRTEGNGVVELFLDPGTARTVGSASFDLRGGTPVARYQSRYTYAVVSALPH